ncbi:NEAT domain-containing protein [Companilactobacillus furfuricola]|uniref:NEAT domain-containing protein n=1 Tax=Companilactobacillus furfuricola TaxID=1462575 RepID=UPI0013DDE4F7|nr:NEAT domain-containing protein [Companilactobacillus furfuricola]
MKNKKLLSFLLTFSLIFISGLIWSDKADAVSLQYQVVQPNGQTSHADQYMDKPANVVIQNGKYYVSMTSSVPSWIGSHPVTYTSINNGDGQIVNNAHGASFKFSTTNLNQLIPVTMHLDVKVANVNMDALVYLKFLNVPALDSGSSNNTNADSNSDANAASDSGNNDAAAADNSDDAAAPSDDNKKVKVEKPVQLNKEDKTPKKDGNDQGNDPDSDSVIYPDKDKKDNKAKKTHYVALASGTVLVVAVVSGVVYYWKRK